MVSVKPTSTTTATLWASQVLAAVPAERDSVPEAVRRCINSCLEELTLLGEGSIPPAWTDYFIAGQPRHRLAHILNKTTRSKGRPRKMTLKRAKLWVSEVEAEKRTMIRRGAPKPTDKAAIRRIAARTASETTPKPRGDTIVHLVDHLAKRLSEARQLIRKMGT